MYKILFIVLVSFALPACTKKTSTWDESLPLRNGQTIKTKFMLSESRCFSLTPHESCLNNQEEPLFEVTLMKNMVLPNDIVWKGKSRPVVIEVNEKGTPYLVVFDRETDFSKIDFRFFRYEGSWTEISPSEFPKNLAVQNTWLKRENGFRDGKPIDEYEIAKKLDPSDIDFDDSLTAKLWLKLEKGTSYYQVQKSSVDHSFLKFYKAQHIMAKP